LTVNEKIWFIRALVVELKISTARWLEGWNQNTKSKWTIFIFKFQPLISRQICPSYRFKEIVEGSWIYICIKLDFFKWFCLAENCCTNSEKFHDICYPLLVFYLYLKNYKSCEIANCAVRFSYKFSFEWSTSQLAQTPSCDFLKMKTLKSGLVESWTRC
jgi:hypothetical protein